MPLADTCVTATPPVHVTLSLRLGLELNDVGHDRAATKAEASELSILSIGFWPPSDGVVFKV
tara:strand:+ start:192 stop:377 length:186 start_codon:yes stop_codon:yes gene_type:complete